MAAWVLIFWWKLVAGLGWRLAAGLGWRLNAGSERLQRPVAELELAAEPELGLEQVAGLELGLVPAAEPAQRRPRTAGPARKSAAKPRQQQALAVGPALDLSSAKPGGSLLQKDRNSDRQLLQRGHLPHNLYKT